MQSLVVQRPQVGAGQPGVGLGATWSQKHPPHPVHEAAGLWRTWWCLAHRCAPEASTCEGPPEISLQPVWGLALLIPGASPGLIPIFSTV